MGCRFSGHLFLVSSGVAAAAFAGDALESSGGAAVAEAADAGTTVAEEAPAAAAAPRDDSAVRPSVVRIEVVARRPDFFRPWRKRSPSRSSGSGVVISGGRVLTNAHVIAFASQIEVQPSGSSDKHAARVVAVDPAIDLALLEFEEAGVADSLPPVELDETIPRLRQPVTVMGYPVGGEEISITEGIVSRVEFTSFYYSRKGLRVQIDAALNPGNSGGPAISGGRLIGVVFSKIREADNIGYLIPGEEVAAFLADAEDGACEGAPVLAGGGRVQTLENAALRRRLGLRPDQTGMAVYEVRDKSNAALRLNDVVTHIGPHPIDNQGFVRVRDDLRLLFSYYVPKLAANGSVPLTIVRGGETLTVDAPTAIGSPDLLSPLMHSYPEYFIWGPIAFTPASQEMAYLDDRLLKTLAYVRSPLVSRMQDLQRTPGEQLVLIPSRFFPHRLTRGYKGVPLATVDAVNGQRVRNLKHLVELLRDADDEFVEFDLAGSHITLVFPREEAESATEEILSDEGIRRQGSPRLMAVWNAEPPAASLAESAAETPGVEGQPETEAVTPAG